MAGRETLRFRLGLRYWTLQEAILEAVGGGLAVSRHTLIVDAASLQPRSPCRMHSVRPSDGASPPSARR